MCVSDMFNLYKYENMLYVMSLSGQEIKDCLEMSYGLWTNRMQSPEDALLWLKEKKTPGERTAFAHPSFNFDSAAGRNLYGGCDEAEWGEGDDSPHGRRLAV